MGQVVTFYSFKGGVGRTMAVANVAYMAASNGLRVLAMDWDLEAPGLAYYFRGHLSPAEQASLRARPGVLDLAWDWHEHARSARRSSDVNALVARARDPQTFEACVATLIPPSRLDGEGTLDLIGAGAASRPGRSPELYEEALMQLSWQSFFAEEAGGQLIDGLRDWARSAYDLVLIDSRTGFADVAGVCTMQLPDTVALCFILNRQNVEGVAKVAAAIGATRGDEVTLRLAPMRLARSDTREEADAKAWARQELREVGGLSPALFDEGMERLGVRSADGVPFYESLAAFIPPDPLVDVLSLNYLSLASAIVGRRLTMQPIDPDWRELVRRRLEPTLATPAYVRDLLTAEPTRAAQELKALITAAVGQTERLEPEYLAALTETAFELWEGGQDEAENLTDDLLGELVDLLHAHAKDDPAPLRDLLVETVERYREMVHPHDSVEAEIAELVELDALYPREPTSPRSALVQAGLKRSLSRAHVARGDYDQALNAANSAMHLLKGHHQAPLNDDRFAMAVVDTLRLIGRISSVRGDVHAAIEAFTSALQEVQAWTTTGPYFDRVALDLHSQLAILLTEYDPTRAAEHAIIAIEAPSWRSGAFVSRLERMADAVMSPADTERYAQRFARGLLTLASRRSAGLPLNTRNPAAASAVTLAAARVAPALGPNDKDILAKLAMEILRMWSQILSRHEAHARSVLLDGAPQDALRQLAAICADFGLDDHAESLANLSSRAVTPSDDRPAHGDG